MAIQTIWIIDSFSGVCIYNWYLKPQDQQIDEQLVSGLLLAFRNFSSEAGLVDISEIEGKNKKLAYQSDDRYIISALCHIKDYGPLVDETLLGMLEGFREKYKKLLEEDSSPDISPYRTFDDDVKKTLSGRSSSRSKVTVAVGTIVSMCLVGAVFAVAFITLGPTRSAIPESADIVMFVELLIGMFLGGLVGGIVAGDRKLGIIASATSVVPILILLIVLMADSWTSVTNKVFYPILYLVVFGSVITLGGLLGGYLKERRFFFKEEEEEETITESAQ